MPGLGSSITCHGPRAVALLVAAAALGACSTIAATTAEISHRTGVPDSNLTCVMPSTAVTITLSDTEPVPSVRVAVGEEVAVYEPASSAGTPTDVTIGHSDVLRQMCTTLFSSGMRGTLLRATAVGTSGLFATVSPASGLLMPAWSGTVRVVHAG